MHRSGGAQDGSAGRDAAPVRIAGKDGDGGVKDKATALSTFESQFAQDIDWLSH